VPREETVPPHHETAPEEAKIGGFTDAQANAAKEFFADFGMAIFAACQLQYRLAHLHSVTFEAHGDGCLPRVDEKRFEALENSFGKAIQIAKKAGSLTGSLLVDVEAAHEVRDYIVHRLFIETRSLQKDEEGFRTLSERLGVARDFFQDVNAKIHEKHAQVFIDAGVPREVYESFRRPWDELSDEQISPEIPIPMGREQIVAAWIARGSAVGPLLLLENADGQLWQIADNGLAHSRTAKSANWTVEYSIQKYLPAAVKSRPSPDSNPPDYRAAFNYGLRFDSGAILCISKRGKGVLQYEMVPPRGGKAKGKRR
jgi:hypothetical protein